MSHEKRERPAAAPDALKNCRITSERSVAREGDETGWLDLVDLLVLSIEYAKLAHERMCSECCQELTGRLRESMLASARLADSVTAHRRDRRRST